MVLILAPSKADVIIIKIIGSKKIKNKKISFLFFFILGTFNFFTKKKVNIKNGIKIPSCFNVNKMGFII